MFIAGFRRIDTTTFPKLYLSDIELSDKDVSGLNPAEVCNTIRGDRDSIDAILVSGSNGTDILDIPDAFSAIRELRPRHMPVILMTCGRNHAALNDLIGAGYADHVLFTFDSVPDREQIRSVSIARDGDCVFSAVLSMSPESLRAEDLAAVADVLAGADTLMLRRIGGKKQYKVNEMASMAKSLKGSAKEVRMV